MASTLKKITLTTLVVAIMLAGSTAHAQEEGFGLEDVVRATVRVHPLLTAGEASVRAARADAVTAGLWQNPTLNLLYTRSFGFTTYDPDVGYPQLMAQQFVELAGLPSARRRAAEALRDAVAADVAVLRGNLVYDAAAAFVNLAAAQARAAVLEEAVTALASADRIVRARVTAGAAPQYDASRIALALAELRAEEGDAEADIVNARGLLDVAVGPGAEALQGVARLDLDAVPSPPPLAELETTLRARRPELAALRARTDAAEAQVTVAQRGVFPGVWLQAGVAVGAGYADPQQRQVDGMVGVTVPLPLADRGQGTVPAAQARAEVLRAQSEAVTVALRQRLRAAWREAERRQQVWIAFREGVASLDATMRREAEAGYQGGRLSVLELVDAYVSFRDARRRGVEMAAATWLARIALLRAAGAPLTPQTDAGFVH